MKIILLRHAETKGNRELRYIGRTDESLSSFGVQQAKEAGSLEEIDWAYVSPLLRTKETAEICFPQAEYIFVDDLMEMNFGDFEDRTAEEMKDDQAFRDWGAGNYEDQCPNGESLEMLKDRVRNAFTCIVADALEKDLEEIAIVTHGGVIMAIMEEFTKPKKPYFSWYVLNCQGYEIFVDKEKWQERQIIDSFKHFQRLIPHK